VKEVIQPSTASVPKGSWSQGIRTGDLLFIAGQVGENSDGEITSPDDFQTQATMAFENVRKVVDAAGGSKDDIVKITAFLTNREDFPAYNEIRAEFFEGNFPASTTVVVKELANPDFLLEIEAIAVVRAVATAD